MTNCGAGMASDDLAQAARHCQKCSQSSGNLQAVWKLMGDIHLQFHAATPPHLVWAQAMLLFACAKKRANALSGSMAIMIRLVAMPSWPDPSCCVLESGKTSVQRLSFTYGVCNSC